MSSDNCSEMLRDLGEEEVEKENVIFMFLRLLNIWTCRPLACLPTKIDPLPHKTFSSPQMEVSVI